MEWTTCWCLRTSFRQEAMAIVRALLSMSLRAREGNSCEILIGGKSWGGVIAVDQAQLSDRPWLFATYTQSRLSTTAGELAQHST